MRPVRKTALRDPNRLGAVRSLFPELSRFPDAAMGREALVRALPRAVATPSYIASVAVVMLAAVLLVACALVWDLSAGVRDWIGAFCVFGPPVAMAGLLFLGRRNVRRCLREELVEAGVRVCVGCGYDLEGVEGARCPECGRQAAHHAAGDV